MKLYMYVYIYFQQAVWSPMQILTTIYASIYSIIY